MNIGFDAKRAFNNNTGLGNHARILINALLRDYPANDYLLFTPKLNGHFLNALYGDYKLILPPAGLYKTVHPLWRSFGVKEDILANRVDVFHGLSSEIPFGIHKPKFRRGFKTVVTIHDLIFLKHAEQFPWIDIQFFKLKTKYAAQYADVVIAVSEETKNDLINYYRTPAEKIIVIYPAVDSSFQSVAPVDFKTGTKYLLNVASFLPRKNQKKLIEAYALIETQIEEELWLVGAGGYLETEIKNLINQKGLEERVKILPDVKQEEMPGIYRNASALVYPSLFEGFGAPVSEALLSRIPVVATRGGAIREAAGQNSVFFDPKSAEDIADKILNVLNDDQLRKRMVTEGYKHALSMTDEKWATKTMEIYRKLV
jgi:glycosyltransferase involved in cell wall biosynthesis